MGFINLGDQDDLQLEIPTIKEKNWGQRFLENFAMRLVEHDHTGNGKGQPIGANSLADDGINGSKLLLNNNEALRSKGSVTGTIISILKVNTSDLIEFLATIASATIQVLSITGSIKGTQVTLDVNGDTSLTLTESGSAKLTYSISTDHKGTLHITESGIISREFTGTDYDVDATLTGTVLSITSTADNLELTYILEEV